jgi:O-antigen/teichoic acid export membrane protein
MVFSITTDDASRSFGYQFLSSIVSTFAGFIFYLYIVHFYPPQIAGVAAMLSAITNLVPLAFSLNLGAGIQHYISYYIGSGEISSIRRIIRKFSMIAVLLSIMSLIFLWFFAPYIDTFFFHNTAYTEYIKLLSFGSIAFVSNSILGSVINGLQKFRLSGLIGIFSSILTYSITIAMLAVFQSPLFIVIGWIIGYSATTCIMAFYVFALSKNIPSSGASASTISPVVSYSLPLFVAALVGTSAMYVDRFVVSFFLNLSLLGIYNFSLLVVTVFGLLTGPFSTVLFSKLSEVYSKEGRYRVKEYASTAAGLLMMMFLPLALIVAAISRSVLTFLAGPAYVLAWAPLTTILIVHSIFVPNSVIGVSLQATRRTRIFFLISSLSLIFNFLFSILLIPRFGIEGAAIGYSSMYFVRFIFLYYFGRRFDTFSLDYVKALKTMLSGLSVFAVLFAFQTYFGYSPLRMFAYIFIGLILYAFMVKMLRTFSASDMDLLTKILPKGFNLKGLIRFILLR